MSAELRGLALHEGVGAGMPGLRESQLSSFRIVQKKSSWGFWKLRVPLVADWTMQKLLLVPLDLRSLLMESWKCVGMRCPESLLHNLCSAPELSGEPLNF